MAKLRFQTVPLPKPGPLFSIRAGADELWIGGEAYGRACLYSSKDGERFVRHPAPELYNSLHAGILPTLDGELLVAGWYGIKRSSGGRKKWPKESPADSSWVLHRASDGVIWAGGEGSALFSTNDGRTWKTAGKSAQPIHALLETAKGMVGLGPACSILGRSSVKVHKKLPGNVYGAAQAPDGRCVAVGLKGLVLRSDNGLDWKRVAASTKEDLYAVAWCGDRFLLGGDNKVLFSLTGDGKLQRETFVAGRRLDIQAIGQFRDRVLIASLAPPRDISESLDVGSVGAGVLVSSGAVATVAKLDVSKFRAAKHETAKQALDRYQRFVDALCAAQLVSNEASFRRSHEPAFYKPLPKAADLAKVEKRLGFKLPPSYRTFVTTYGRFSFGKGTNESRLLLLSELEPLDTLIPRQWGLDFESDVGLAAADIKHFRNTIPFANGDDQLQIIWFYSFRIDGQRKDGECPIVPFDQDEVAVYAKPLKTFRKPAQTFDEHIGRRVDQKIAELAEEYVK